MGRNPFWQASTAVARTQPLVVQPVTMSVSTPCASRRYQIGAKKARGVFLDDERFRALKIHTRIDFNGRASRAQRCYPLLLQSPYTGILQIVIIVSNGGKKDRDTPFSRDVEQGLDGRNLRVEIRAQRHVRIGKSIEDIDHNESRPLSEAYAQAKTPLLEKFLVADRFRRIHGAFLSALGISGGWRAEMICAQRWLLFRMK
jgi:hypothetical protein